MLVYRSCLTLFIRYGAARKHYTVIISRDTVGIKKKNRIFIIDFGPQKPNLKDTILWDARDTLTKKIRIYQCECALFPPAIGLGVKIQLFVPSLLHQAKSLLLIFPFTL